MRPTNRSIRPRNTVARRRQAPRLLTIDRKIPEHCDDFGGLNTEPARGRYRYRA